MLGQPRPYDKVPYFFPDQYDRSMQYRGRSGDGEELVIRPGDSEDRFMAFWVRDSRVAAAMNANVWDQGEALEKLITSGAQLDKAVLADPDRDPASLIAPSAGVKHGLESGRL